MVSFEATVSGGQIGDALSDDVEEFAEALVHIASEMDVVKMQELSDYLNSQTPHDKARVANWAQRVMEMCRNEAPDT